MPMRHSPPVAQGAFRNIGRASPQSHTAPILRFTNVDYLHVHHTRNLRIRSDHGYHHEQKVFLEMPMSACAYCMTYAVPISPVAVNRGSSPMFSRGGEGDSGGKRRRVSKQPRTANAPLAAQEPGILVSRCTLPLSYSFSPLLST